MWDRGARLGSCLEVLGGNRERGRAAVSALPLKSRSTGLRTIAPRSGGNGSVLPTSPFSGRSSQFTTVTDSSGGASCEGMHFNTLAARVFFHRKLGFLWEEKETGSALTEAPAPPLDWHRGPEENGPWVVRWLVTLGSALPCQGFAPTLHFPEDLSSGPSSDRAEQVANEHLQKACHALQEAQGTLRSFSWGSLFIPKLLIKTF